MERMWAISYYFIIVAWSVILITPKIGVGGWTPMFSGYGLASIYVPLMVVSV